MGGAAGAGAGGGATRRPRGPAPCRGRPGPGREQRPGRSRRRHHGDAARSGAGVCVANLSLWQPAAEPGADWSGAGSGSVGGNGRRSRVSLQFPGQRWFAASSFPLPGLELATAESLPVRLPPGTRVLAVRADGVWLDVVPLGRRTCSICPWPARSRCTDLKSSTPASFDRPSGPFGVAGRRCRWNRWRSGPPGACRRPLRRCRSHPSARLPGGSSDTSKGLPASLGEHLLDTAPEDRSARLDRQLVERWHACAAASTREPCPADRLLGTLAYEDFKEPVPLVLDTWALNDAALTCTTPVAPAAETARRQRGCRPLCRRSRDRTLPVGAVGDNPQSAPGRGIRRRRSVAVWSVGHGHHGGLRFRPRFLQPLPPRG